MKKAAFQESEGENVVVEDNIMTRGACQRLYTMGMWRSKANSHKFHLLLTPHADRNPSSSLLYCLIGLPLGFRLME